METMTAPWRLNSSVRARARRSSFQHFVRWRLLFIALKQIFSHYHGKRREKNFLVSFFPLFFWFLRDGKCSKVVSRNHLSNCYKFCTNKLGSRQSTFPFKLLIILIFFSFSGCQKNFARKMTLKLRIYNWKTSRNRQNANYRKNYTRSRIATFDVSTVFECASAPTCTRLRALVHAHVRVRTCLCAHSPTLAHVCVCAYVHIDVHTFAHLCTRVCACTFEYVYV